MTGGRCPLGLRARTLLKMASFSQVDPDRPRRVLVVPGFDAAPADNWFPWLDSELEGRGVRTTVVALPSPGSPDRDQWDEAIRSELDVLDGSTSVVAHSLGCVAVLRHLARRQDRWRLASLVLVAGFLDPVPGLPQLDRFVRDIGDLTGITDRIGTVTVLRSDDDPSVPRDHTDRLARTLDVTPVEVRGAGHFTTEDGMTRLPQVLDALGIVRHSPDGDPDSDPDEGVETGRESFPASDPPATY